jgi:hypothetical protein
VAPVVAAGVKTAGLRRLEALALLVRATTAARAGLSVTQAAAVVVLALSVATVRQRQVRWAVMAALAFHRASQGQQLTVQVVVVGPLA